eukprot:m.640677 g.640677  ORF g.640677 m.640677 type:complete len:160 (+) comp22622_c0_seq15:983-1462(+)
MCLSVYLQRCGRDHMHSCGGSMTQNPQSETTCVLYVHGPLLVLNAVVSPSLQTKHSDFFRFVIDRLQRHSSPLLGRLSRHWAIMLSTGPTFIWLRHHEYLKTKRSNPNYVQVDRMPAWVWGYVFVCAWLVRSCDVRRACKVAQCITMYKVSNVLGIPRQ